MIIFYHKFKKAGIYNLDNKLFSNLDIFGLLNDINNMILVNL